MKRILSIMYSNSLGVLERPGIVTDLNKLPKQYYVVEVS